MLIRFIGDVHGKYAQYKRIIAVVENSIQVGDMGVGFRRFRSVDPRMRRAASAFASCGQAVAYVLVSCVPEPEMDK